MRCRRTVVGGALGLLLALGWTGAVAAAPAANVPPLPNFDSTCVELAGRIVSGYCGYDPPTGRWRRATPAREAAALQAIDAARAGEGLGPLVVPDDMAALTPDEQQFVIVDLERVARGLPPVMALAPALDALALAGAAAGTDPRATGVWADYPGGSNWAADAQPAAAMYRYMYQDGWGGSAAATPNIDCTGPGGAGCWGHRRNVLVACSPTCIMGVGTVAPAGGGLGSSAQIFVRYDGFPVPVAYTWTDALLAGAAGGLPPATDPDPLWPFADLAGAPWAAGAVAFLRAEGVVRGTGPGVFDPAAPVQLQDLVTLLGRILGWPAEPGFAPPGSAPWAAGAMGYARSRDLLPAGAAPSGPASRAEAAALVVGALRLPAVAAPMPYVDLAGLSGTTLTALTTAVADGLLEGDAVGRLDPAGDLSRAEAVVLLQRAVLGLARDGAQPALALPLSARAVAGGGVLYTAGGLRMLAPAAAADPVVYWESGSLPEETLLEAGGAWWSGLSTSTAEAPPGWAAGATSYGRASAALWPAGAQNVGPALFRPIVRVVAFGAQTQELLPGAIAWSTAPVAAVSDPVRALAKALVP